MWSVTRNNINQKYFTVGVSNTIFIKRHQASFFELEFVHQFIDCTKFLTTKSIVKTKLEPQMSPYLVMPTWWPIVSTLKPRTTQPWERSKIQHYAKCMICHFNPFRASWLGFLRILYFWKAETYQIDHHSCLFTIHSLGISENFLQLRF